VLGRNRANLVRRELPRQGAQLPLFIGERERDTGGGA
jgi:hypothetical protein